MDQFLQSVSNHRTDSYGGPIANRLRFPLRVLNAVCAAIGPERVGIRMSPFGIVQGMRERVPMDTFLPWAKAIVAAQPRLAYVHAVTPRTYGTTDMPDDMVIADDDLGPIRDVVRGAGIAFISAGGYRPDAAREVSEKHGDLVGFGRYFICES